MKVFLMCAASFILCGMCAALGYGFAVMALLKKEEEKPSKEELEKEKRRLEEWDELMNYAGPKR